MKIKDIYNYLNDLSPFELQEKWDNSGLIVGNMEDQFENIYIALDLDLDMIEKIEPNSVIITHHPLIFRPIKKVNNDRYATKLLKILIKKDIRVIAMHTNMDKTHLNSYVGNNILGLNFEKSDDFIVTAKIDMSFEQLQEHIKKKLGLKILKVTTSTKKIKTVSLTTGSGMSLLPYITTDCFLTGDIKYHDAMEAKALGISLIDIGHFESEIHFCTLLESLIQNYLKKNNKTAIIIASQNPFEYK